VRRETGEERARPLRAERATGQHARREESGEPEPREDKRMSRDADQRTKRVRREVIPLADERLDEPSIRPAVRPEPRGRRVD